MKKSSLPPTLPDAPTSLKHGREVRTNGLREMADAKTQTMERKEAVQPKKQESSQPEDINESAEAFIKKFRQQLLIQRLESLENYEQMLERGL
ncbi:hypothetical protein CJ030_MR3G026559 [Morella rubra]|uniref:DUF761 domain-containing protein n=1 Tax=Morella rubra TaxID=262757 RepID=A0A6A1W0A9_9ROSI|nr:hypothetical protein CJ030_MR3G026559 [Morella rubra]